MNYRIGNIDVYLYQKFTTSSTLHRIQNFISLIIHCIFCKMKNKYNYTILRTKKINNFVKRERWILSFWLKFVLRSKIVFLMVQMLLVCSNISWIFSINWNKYLLLLPKSLRIFVKFLMKAHYVFNSS